MDFLLEILKIVGYIGGGFLIAFRVAKYYIERDRELKSENDQMKKDVKALGDKIDNLNMTIKDYNVIQSRVKTLEEDNRELKENYKDILEQLIEIRLSLKDKVNRV